LVKREEMKLQSEIELIKKELDKVDDVHLIDAIKNILAYGKAKRYESGLSPMTKEEFYSRNELSRKAIERGELIDQSKAREFFSGKHAG
jgi:hypothetical protein